MHCNGPPSAALRVPSLRSAAPHAWRSPPFPEAFVVFSLASSTVVGSLIFLSVSRAGVLVRWLRCSCKLAGLQAVFRFLSFSFERWHYTLLFQALLLTKSSRFGKRLRRTSACTPTGRKCCFSGGAAFCRPAYFKHFRASAPVG